MVDIVADFLDALDLTDVTLVVTDWGGPLFLTDIGRDKRVARLVICPSEAFDNFPPGFPGKVAWLASRTTGTVWLAMHQLRIGWLRKRWLMFGMMSDKPIPQDVIDEWMAAGLADRRSAATSSSTAAPSSTSRPDPRDPPARRSSTARAGAVERQPGDAGRPRRATGRAAAPGAAALIDDAYVLVMLDQPERTAQRSARF